MADDIVARLRQMAKANGCEAGRGCSEAADVIERLWAVGDALADAAIRQQWSRLDVAVAAWQEARRV